MNYNDKQLKKIESAVVFASAQFSKYSKNPKPALLHSIKVGVKLMEYDVPYEVVVAGFLHDLLEDTKCTKTLIRNKFGSKVLNYVSALTMDYQLTNYKERWFDAIKRITNAGKSILLVKLIDCYDNLPYYNARMTKVVLGRLLWKSNLILTASKKDFSRYDIYRQFNIMFQKIKKSKGIILP